MTSEAGRGMVPDCGSSQSCHGRDVGQNDLKTIRESGWAQLALIRLPLRGKRMEKMIYSSCTAAPRKLRRCVLASSGHGISPQPAHRSLAVDPS